ncbi:phospholipid:lipid A palmitoyltransferase [Salmonella enterica subsp. enterica]|uniref:Phospholipid:lipid A palmitoyltransferase n=1 Tax=Salmonella enterica I TaxID=59201 RepID=A0A3S4I6Q3_SALET|nr:phospholipid:lipid A palmitoyltransferase [Salmonella enterica subsp. enterica]
MYVAMIIRKYFLIIALLLMPWLAIPSVSAADKGWFNTFTDNVAETWRQPEHYDLYVPAITWHARFAYDKEKTDRYNERPWGVGFGQSRWDDKGNWHGLYMMAFKDSFNKWEPIGGYGWEKTWRPLEDDNFSPWTGLYRRRYRARQLELYSHPCAVAFSVDRLWSRYLFR